MFSLSGKNWVIENESLEGSVLERVLKNRSIADLESPLSRLHDPFLMRDMKKTVERIQKAVGAGERIMIYGDYDVDGVTGSAILYSVLSEAGAKVSVRIANRFGFGYGLNESFIEECRKLKVSLIITVDCGISDALLIAMADSYGIDTIVTDHHTVPEAVPGAHAILNPKLPDCVYPEKNLCGAGVVFKLVQALLDVSKKSSDSVLQYLDLTALATVADCMPLIGENRILVKNGLVKLQEDPHPSLDALMSEAEVDRQKLSTATFGFQIGPPLNAAGRLDSALDSFFLLTGKKELASKLVSANKDRQGLMKHGITEAEKMIGEIGDLRMLIVKNKNWGIGIIGLIASKIAEKFHRPSLVLSERQGELVGSARSISGYSIIEALTRHKELFIHFGGHAQAAGFSLAPEKYDEFMDVMEQDAYDHIQESDLVPTLRIDTEIQPEEVSFKSVEELSRLEPFGLGNARPSFLMKDRRVRMVGTVGTGKDHLSFMVGSGDRGTRALNQNSSNTIQGTRAIAFGFGKHADLLNSDKKFDLVVQVERDNWNGQDRLQLNVRDIGTRNMEH